MPTALGTVASHRTATATGSVLPVTDGVAAWFDADDASTFTFGTGSAVSEWRSKIAATKLVQTDPTYRPPRTGTLNGRPTLAFTAHALHGNPWPQSLGVESLFIVMVPRNNADGRYLLGCERNRGSLPRKLRFLGAKLHMDFAGGGTGTTTASPTLNVAVVYESVRNVPTHGVSGPWQMYFNGVLDTDTSSIYGGLYNDGTQDLGGDYYDYPDYGNGNFIGDIAEIVQYNRYLSTVERQQVESYLYWKWMATPPPFTTTGLVGWWDAADAATITASSGAVSQWNDKSGLGRHLTQTVAASKPTTGIRTLNGKNVLDYTGDFLASTVATVNQPCTAFFVAQSDENATGVNRRPFGGVGNTLYLWIDTGNNWLLYGGGYVYFSRTLDTNPHALCFVADGASSAVFYDGTQTATGNPGGFFVNQLHIGAGDSGGSYPWDGVIAEVIIYDRVLSTVERQQVDAYLKTKWGTP